MQIDLILRRWTTAAVLPSALGLAGGLALAISGEPWLQSYAGFVAVALLSEALARSARGSRPIWHAALVGLAFGTLVNAIALFSLVELLVRFGHFPAPLAWLVAGLGWAAQGLPYAVASALTSACALRGLSRWLCLPPLLAASASWVPQLFPWRLAGPQVNFLYFVQMADLGGEPLIDLCVAFVGAGCHEVLRARGRARLHAATIAACALLVPCAYGWWRIGAVRELRAAAPSLRIGVVQSNVGISLKGQASHSAQILSNLRSMTARLERRAPDLTLWAETAYPFLLARSSAQQPAGRQRIVDPGLPPGVEDHVLGPILFGALTYTETDTYDLVYNSAWLVRRDGWLGDRVDKSRLLAFGEYVPFWHWLPPLQARFPSPGLQAGENDVIRLEQPALGEIKLGMLICYEDLFFSLARQVVERGGQLLVNMTNDAWFGHSHEPALHDMVARLRAIETRRDLVRAVNTGVSSFSTATGELVTRTRSFEKASFIAEAKLLAVRSLYVRLGDWVSPLCALTVLAAVLRVRRR